MKYWDRQIYVLSAVKVSSQNDMQILLCNVDKDFNMQQLKSARGTQ